MSAGWAVGGNGFRQGAVAAQDRQVRVVGGEFGPGRHRAEQRHGCARTGEIGAIAASTAPERDGPLDTPVLEDFALALEARDQSPLVVPGRQRACSGRARGVGRPIARDPRGPDLAVNKGLVERHNATDHNRNAGRAPKMYCFSKDWWIHRAVTFFTMYSDNFCWPIWSPPSAS
jgi:hypothetical protein